MPKFLKDEIIRKILLPYDDLQIEGSSDRRLGIPDDITPTLAILVGQGPNGPKLIETDASGNLVAPSAPTTSGLTAELYGTQSNNNTPIGGADPVVILTGINALAKVTRIDVQTWWGDVSLPSAGYHLEKVIMNGGMTDAPLTLAAYHFADRPSNGAGNSTPQFSLVFNPPFNISRAWPGDPFVNVLYQTNMAAGLRNADVTATYYVE